MLRGLFRPLYLLFATLVVGLAYAAGMLAYHHVNYQNRVFPGVRLQGIDLSGMTPEEVFAIAQIQSKYFHLPAITVQAADQRYVFRPADFGVGLDPAETARVALSVGRRGDLQTQIRQRFEAWWQGVDVSPVVRLDDSEIAHIVRQVARQTERPAIDARIVFEGGVPRASPSQVGRELDEAMAIRLIRSAMMANRPADIVLPYKTLEPRVVSVAAAADEIARIVSNDLIVMTPRWDDAGNPLPPLEAFRIRKDDMLDFVLIEQPPDDPANISVRLRREKLRAMVEPLGKAVAQQAQNARFTFNPATGQLRAIAPSRDARALDIEATLDALEAAARGTNRSATLVVKITPAPVPATATAQDLGITQLITQATTFFKGSSAARLANVKVAAARFNGVVVPPGAVFSFNEHLGDVSEKEGFQEGLIIVGNRTVKGVGGGVCQVSTTAYQAALRAGFPIVERYPHGYRVSYYERGMGPGFDASVFSPYADLKFINDTNAHLLIETIYDPVRVTLTFKFYGTPDGRQVTISPATITDVVPHGPDIYERDTEGEVPPGQAKQVDYAVDGATVFFTRVVTRNGETLINERVVSKYVPWQAVYRYGPDFTPPEGAIVRN
ncbi:MAG: VanW family protein [Anaerolineae bacterium]|nr:VanW family protein [Candidatus Roseilinea sp.]MDW8450853.1 VanW family protein [Anaerolineae bacterium]